MERSRQNPVLLIGSHSSWPKAYAQATCLLEGYRSAKGPNKTFNVVFDIDDTLLTESQDEQGYRSMDEVLDLVDACKAVGARVYIITARSNDPSIVFWTASQLARIGLLSLTPEGLEVGMRVNDFGARTLPADHPVLAFRRTLQDPRNRDHVTRKAVPRGTKIRHYDGLFLIPDVYRENKALVSEAKLIARTFIREKLGGGPTVLSVGDQWTDGVLFGNERQIASLDAASNAAAIKEDLRRAKMGSRVGDPYKIVRVADGVTSWFLKLPASY